MADELTGADAFIRQLIAGGVRHVFGNPGTTEQPFIGRLRQYPELQFIVALHESVAVAAAEGYARASGGVGVVELHAGPGLGNALGMLYNAAEGRTPLLVYVGQAEQDSLYLEPTLSGDFVAQSHPIAKWAHEVRTANEIPQIVRRALKVVLTPPCGPVVLSIPMDVMERPCNGSIVAPSLVPTAVRPDPIALQHAADVIARADAPVVLVGDGVARAGAIAELGEFANLIGAPIYGAFMNEACVEPDEPLNAGRLPSIDGSAAERVLAPFDTVVAVGTKVLSQIFAVPGLPLGEREVVHIGLDTWELAKNQPSTIVLGDERATLRELNDVLAARLAPREVELAARRDAVQTRLAAAKHRAAEVDRARWDEAPMSPERAMAELAALMPQGACLVDESISSYGAVGRSFRFEPGRWFRLRGGGIGEGLPMPIGIQLARPGTPVVALVGDGSALYTITALWTAAHHRLPITWVILNNRSYKILKENARRDDVSTQAADALVGVDLTDPDLDFVSLARGCGVEAHRVDDPEGIQRIFPAAVAADHPVLIDLVISDALTRR